MPVTVAIRDITPSDHEQWLPLWDGYNAFYGRSGATALPEEITQTTWARFFDPHEPMHALVAESDGRLCGLVHYIFHRSTILLAPTCYLQDLFTDVSQRRNGVGRALIEAVYDAARAAGSGAGTPRGQRRPRAASPQPKPRASSEMRTLRGHKIKSRRRERAL